jgi:putative acetyltransferase
MLFISPSARGKGIGKILLAHAISNLSIRFVDINEQNKQAVGFYQYVGFEVFDRSPVDGHGNHYPLLHMKLNTFTH